MKFSNQYHLFFLVLSSLWWAMTSALDCIEGEEQVDFTFSLDEDSRLENGWSLTCVTPSSSSSSLVGNEESSIVVWNVPMGSLLQSNKNIQSFSSNPFIQERACIATDATCHFTLEDLNGDGLLHPGYYYLVYGATTIAVSEEGAEYFEQTYCFGPNCPVVPLEEREDESPCDDLYLFFHADNAPEESLIEIECDGEIVYFKDDFLTAQELIEFEQCIPKNTCCHLTVGDSGFDGIDPSQGGHIFLEWANEVVFEYDDTDPFEFKKLTRQFGSTCGGESGVDGTTDAARQEEEDVPEFIDEEEDKNEDEETTTETVEEPEMEAEVETPSDQNFEDQDAADAPEDTTTTESTIEDEEESLDEAIDPTLDAFSEETTKGADDKGMPRAAKIALFVVGSLVSLVAVLCAATACGACAASCLTPLADEQGATTTKGDNESVSTMSHDPSTDDEETQ